ncbi:uncharacterized protein BT62DRAFT_1078126 [Guyanagaster necrorhizus]|uniref:Uncharacterized protein n=1 Tax=Guyanagaster necrorhizus TaxID=856835 RepID=A0A9P7VMJ4_9AGAR|nr:uncharacterized protein BT62DRAFT_1078126 [Guyanagaster necrorhizus MCA 3950]KAG7443953.1 hypothetical protein BT62DRAFT_1078126 [Guyanagaster necrorhizus MCA 3950]
MSEIQVYNHTDGKVYVGTRLNRFTTMINGVGYYILQFSDKRTFRCPITDCRDAPAGTPLTTRLN